MSDEPQEGEYPEEDFEIIELETDPFLTEEQKSWPVVESEYSQDDFAIEEPLPVLLVTPADGHVAGDAGQVPALVEATSAYEVSLGGGGLRVFDSPRPAGVDRNGAIALVPWKAEGARDRLERVAAWIMSSGRATDARVA